MSDERTPLLNESNHSISSGEETMGFRKNLNPQVFSFLYLFHYYWLLIDINETN